MLIKINLKKDKLIKNILLINIFFLCILKSMDNNDIIESIKKEKNNNIKYLIISLYHKKVFLNFNIIDPTVSCTLEKLKIKRIINHCFKKLNKMISEKKVYNKKDNKVFFSTEYKKQFKKKDYFLKKKEKKYKDYSEVLYDAIRKEEDKEISLSIKYLELKKKYKKYEKYEKIENKNELLDILNEKHKKNLNLYNKKISDINATFYNSYLMSFNLEEELSRFFNQFSLNEFPALTIEKKTLIDIKKKRIENLRRLVFLTNYYNNQELKDKFIYEYKKEEKEYEDEMKNLKNNSLCHIF